jgi:hypothetical protein
MGRILGMPRSKEPMSVLETQNFAFDINKKYGRALAKIEQLESELQHKTCLLENGLQDQLVLRDKLTQCLNEIKHSHGIIKSAEADFNELRQQWQHHINAVEQENAELILANGAWVNRSIQQEFDLIKAQEKITKMSAALELALSKINLLGKNLRIF